MSLIRVRTSFQGIHFWPEAPEEVAFLRFPHRHVFHVAAICEVSHDDRELEFFIVRQAMDNVIAKFVPYHEKMPDLKLLGRESCESIALTFEAALRGRFNRPWGVTVQEDGENAGILPLAGAHPLQQPDLS